MKKFLFLAALVVAALQLTAANVDMATAQQSAQRFLVSQSVMGRFATSAPTVKWTHEVKNTSDVTKTALYIVNTDKGYVIVSGDDRAKEVLAYGEGSLNSLNDLPEAVQYFLDIYQKQMEYLQAHPGLVVQKRAATRGVSVEPMLQTAWAQDKPYNKQCPKVGSTYCKTGCTATALAQVIRYWEYPSTAPALPAYTCETSGINVPALAGGYTFDWANMYDTYYEVDLDRLPQVNEDAIAYLMRYVGQAEKVDYNTDQTGTRNPEILTAILTFGYDQGAHIVKKVDSPDTQEDLAAGNYTEEEYYNDAEWAEAIQAELRAGRPLVYCAYDMSSDSTGIGGHAFNVDGYDAENDMYHVNFGMKPSLNTYYALNAFSTDGWLVVYDFWPIFFAGVQPPGMTTDPRIFVSPQNLNMECYVGETTTATFDVSGDNLTGNITLTLSDENGVFTADAATISLDELTKTVTVTYAPQAVGTHNATITLASEGAESKVVTIKGTATNAPLVVYNPVMLPADSAYINLTSFRADWTDQTAAENVLSYTLEVNEQITYDYLAVADWSETVEVFVNQAGSWATSGLIPEGWTFNGSNLWAEDNFISISSATITTNDFTSGSDKVTVVVSAKGLYGTAAFTVATGAESQTINLPRGNFAEYRIVLNCNETDHVTFTAGSSYVGLLNVTVLAGEVAAPTLRATETGDATYRLVTGITDKFYTVSDLTAEGTFLYKVKALYIDGTESAWSNIQEVTLFDNGLAPHGFDPGDVNHDGAVSIKDVTALIDYLLGSSSSICTICADVNGDENVTIKDVTALIDLLLGAN